MSFQLVKKTKSEKKEPSGSLNENCVLQLAAAAAGCVFKHKQNSVIFLFFF